MENQNQGQTKPQLYRWVQIVISEFGANRFEISIGTTSSADKHNGLQYVINKHFLELQSRRADQQPVKTWIGFTSSSGESSIQSLDGFTFQQ